MRTTVASIAVLGILIFVLGAATEAAPPRGARIEITTRPAPILCFQSERNRSLRAHLTGGAAGDSVRVYFRRLHPPRSGEESYGSFFYWVEMLPEGGGAYWTVLPKPEERGNVFEGESETPAEPWWRKLPGRPAEGAQPGEAPDWWLREPSAVEEWLETLEMEAVEFYLAVYAAGGEFRARTAVDLAEVRPRDDCEQEGTVLDPRESGLARNLTIGETDERQAGHPVFHWLCDGIVTRIGHDELIREDEFCRACVIGERRPYCPA